MSGQLELLERYYNTFINFENPKDFFIGLADYIDFVKDTPEFDRILTDLLDQMKIIEFKLNEQGSMASKKLSEIHKELSDYISKNKIADDTINEALRDYEGWIEGKIMGASKPQGLYEELSDIIQWLYEKPEHKEFASRFIVFNERKTNVRYFLYPEEYKEFYENWQEVKARYQSELWGQMNEVIRHYQIIKTGREKRKQLVKSAVEDNNFRATYELISSHTFLLGEWTSIEEGKYDKLTFFKVNKFKPIIIRFQNYLLKELSRIKDTEPYAREINLNELSVKNLLRIEKVLRVVLDELELQEIDCLIGNKISLKVLEKEGILFDEAETILNQISCVEVMNERLGQAFPSRRGLPIYELALPPIVSEKDLDEYLFLNVKDLNKLKKITEEVHKKIEEMDKDKEYQKTLDGFQIEIDTINSFVGEAKKQILTEALTNPPPIKPTGKKEAQSRAIERMAREGEEAEKAQKINSLEVKVAGLEKIISKKGSGRNQTEQVNLLLSKNGELCNEKSRCYKMGETSKRHKLIRFLAGNTGYQPTSTIADVVGYKNNQTTSGEIIKIRKNVKRDLGVKGKDFLQSKKDSGYRINPRYKIKIKD